MFDIGLIALVVIVLLAVGLFLLFRMSWRIAEPDEALIISGMRSGSGAEGGGKGFRIVTGRGVLVLPGVTKVRTLSLEAHESEITCRASASRRSGSTCAVSWSTRWATTIRRSPTPRAASSTAPRRSSSPRSRPS